MKSKNFLFFLFFLPASVAAQKRITSERIEVTSSLDARPAERALRVIAPFKLAVDSVTAPVLGQSAVAMSGGRPESLLGNWAADVLVEFSDLDGKGRADMGLMNVGGLRNNMPQGPVTRGDIMLISPFQNKLVVVTLKGEHLLELMQNIAAVGGEAVSREVRLEITGDGKLRQALVSGQPIDPARSYRVATLDYLAEGNDRMTALTHATERRESGLLTRDLMMRSLEAAGTITAQLEGRVRKISD